MRSRSSQATVGFLLLILVVRLIPAATKCLITFEHAKSDMWGRLSIADAGVGEWIGTRLGSADRTPESEIPEQRCARLE